jgi:hypothetical protein
MKQTIHTERATNESERAVNVTFVGKLTIGKTGSHQICSSLTDTQDIIRYAEKLRAYVVRADEHNCAVCMGWERLSLFGIRCHEQ